MPDSNTPLLLLVDQENGGNLNTWGSSTKLNGNIDIIDQALQGQTSLTLTSGTTTLSESQRRQAILKLTGTLSGNCIIEVANLEKTWLIYNGCTVGPYDVTMKTASGDAAHVDTGMQVLWCDGNDVIGIED